MPPPDDDPLASAVPTTGHDAACLDPTPTTGKYHDGVPSNQSPAPATVLRAPSPGGAPVSAHPAVDPPGPPLGVKSTGSVSTAVATNVASAETDCITPTDKPIDSDYTKHGGGAPMKAAEPGRAPLSTVDDSSKAKVDDPPRPVGDGNNPTRSTGGTACNLNSAEYSANDRRGDTSSGTETTFPATPVTGVEKEAEKRATDVSATIAPTNPDNPDDPSVQSDREKQLAQKGGAPVSDVDEPHHARQKLDVETLAQKAGARADGMMSRLISSDSPIVIVTSPKLSHQLSL